MKNEYRNPEIQIILIQQQDDLMIGSSMSKSIDFNSFENQAEDLDFDFDGFDDDDFDL